MAKENFRSPENLGESEVRGDWTTSGRGALGDTTHGWNRPDDAGTSAPDALSGSSNTAYSGTAYKSKDTSGNLFGSSGAGHASASAGDFGGGESSSQEQRKDDRHSAKEGWSGQSEKWMGQAQDAVKNARHLASDAAGAAQDYVREISGQAQEIAEEAVETMSASVRRNPTQAILLGFGVGCLIGLWLLPRRRPS